MTHAAVEAPRDCQVEACPQCTARRIANALAHGFAPELADVSLILDAWRDSAFRANRFESDLLRVLHRPVPAFPGAAWSDLSEPWNGGAA